MSGFSTRPSRALPPACFLIFWRWLSDAPVGDRGGEDRDIGRQRRLDRRQHLPRRLDLHDGDAARIGHVHRAGNQHHLGAGRGRGRGDGVALLAGGAVGDVAHRIDRLVRRARSDEHALARERLVALGLPSSASAAATISSGSAMRPMPASPASAISPAFGPTMATPSAASCARLRCVARCAHICGFIAGAIRTGGRSRAARRWRDRRHGRSPSSP